MEPTAWRPGAMSRGWCLGLDLWPPAAVLAARSPASDVWRWCPPRGLPRPTSDCPTIRWPD